MTDINTAAQEMGGEWVQLRSKADGIIEGRVISFERRPMTFEGNPVLSRKTGAQRTEWVLTILKDDDEVIKFSLKEGGQRAISQAIKDCGQPAKNGDRLKIAVTEDKPTERSQPTYKAKWTPDATPLDIPVTVPDEEPF